MDQLPSRTKSLVPGLHVSNAVSDSQNWLHFEMFHHRKRRRWALVWKWHLLLGQFQRSIRLFVAISAPTQTIFSCRGQLWGATPDRQYVGNCSLLTRRQSLRDWYYRWAQTLHQCTPQPNWCLHQLTTRAAALASDRSASSRCFQAAR